MQAWEELAYAKRDGREEAKKEADIKLKEAVANMKADGVSIDTISKWLGLSENEFLELE